MPGWNDTFKIGLPHIDAQHQQLFDLIDELHQAMLAGKSKEVLGKVLGKLVDYTVKHFGTEEALMRSAHCPTLRDHMREHEQFAAKVKEFERQYREGKALITVGLMDFLQNWLVNHINAVDKRLASELNAA